MLDAFIVPAEVKLLIVEGNYLLLGNAPWWRIKPLLDLAVFVEVPREKVRARLLRRNREHIERVDLANYDTVQRSKGRADVVVELVTAS